MVYNTPTIEQLKNQALNDIKTELPESDPARKGSVLGVLGKVLAGLVYGLYRFLLWILKQGNPATADTSYLDSWASVWGMSRNDASYSTGSIQPTGTNGTSIPSGSYLQYNGVQYVTVAAGQVGDSIAVSATEPGAGKEVPANASLTFVSPIAGVNLQAPTALGIGGGADQESDDDLRERLIYKISNPQGGGTEDDYIEWAREVPGVTRAWAYHDALDDSVHVMFMRDGESPAIPSSQEIAAVQAHIETVRPITADVVVHAPALKTQAFTIDGLIPDTPANRSAIETALKNLIDEKAAPNALISQWEYIAAVASTGLTIDGITSPTSGTTTNQSEIHAMGTITWT